MADKENVKIRIRRIVDEVDKKTGKPTGKTRNAAQPIVLVPRLAKQWKGAPARLEVGGTYECPEAIAKALGPDVEVIG
jgi:hypothetical protein